MSWQTVNRSGMIDDLRFLAALLVLARHRICIALSDALIFSSFFSFLATGHVLVDAAETGSRNDRDPTDIYCHSTGPLLPMHHDAAMHHEDQSDQIARRRNSR